LDDIVHRGSADQVIVVDDEDAVLLRAADFVKNGAQQLRDRDLPGIDERKKTAERGKVPLQHVTDMTQEERGVGILRIEGEPERGGGIGTFQQRMQPQGTERGLPVAGRGDDLNQGKFTPLGQRFEEPWPANPVPPSSRKGVGRRRLIINIDNLHQY
jgi:hypothetical protein